MLRTRITPYFSVTTMFFAVAMALLAAIAWKQLPGITLPSVLATAIALVAAVVAMVFPHQPWLARRIGLILGLVGTIAAVPAFLRGLIAMGQGTLSDANMTATMASMGAICSVYAAFAAVSVRRDHAISEMPA